VEIDSVVVATGFTPYDPLENTSYGYGQSPNIISGIDAELQLSTQNSIARPSDGETPRRIAFIQCVGSRSEETYRRSEDADYCSSVCCAYSLRIAQVLAHQSRESKITFFYMDIQNFGKDFDTFFDKCRGTMNFIRSRPYEISPNDSGGLDVKFAPHSASESDEREISELEFDLVVLAVGIRPSPETVGLAESLKIPVDANGFVGFKSALPLPDLQRQGIYAVGACESPKDIASCMAQAEAVSAAICRAEKG
jgi:heterodisulfide reductase subunit A